MKTIGTDLSIKECKAEGYLIMKYDARRKFSHDIEVYFEQYLPEYERKNKPLDFGKQWTTLNTKYLWDMYESRKASIQSFADYHVENIDEIKNYYDLLLLADNVNAYMGIFN